jgi:CBS-domain-containing membrane protein
MIVRDLMSRAVVTVRDDAPLGEICDLFQRERVHGAPVLGKHGEIVGFLSQEDLLMGGLGQSVGGPRGTSRRAPVPRARDVMTAPAMTTGEDTPLEDLCRMMWSLRIHHVPVVGDGKIVGMVSALDLCRAVAEGRLGR